FLLLSTRKNDLTNMFHRKPSGNVTIRKFRRFLFDHFWSNFFYSIVSKHYSNSFPLSFPGFPRSSPGFPVVFLSLLLQIARSPHIFMIFRVLTRYQGLFHKTPYFGNINRKLFPRFPWAF